MVYGTDENVYVEIASMYNMVNVLLNNTDMHHLSRTLAKYNTNTRKSIDILHHLDIYMHKATVLRLATGHRRFYFSRYRREHEAP
jgi:hypothetical protein